MSRKPMSKQLDRVVSELLKASHDKTMSPAKRISRGGQTRAGAGELAQEAGGPESGQITTETTEAGELTVIPGAQKISDNEQAQR